MASTAEAIKAGYTQVVEDEMSIALIRPQEGVGMPEWTGDADELLLVTKDLRERYTEEWLEAEGYEELEVNEAVVIAPLSRKELYVGER
ncbi:hypothetical protein D3C77_447350 [compost metagenome]